LRRSKGTVSEANDSNRDVVIWSLVVGGRLWLPRNRGWHWHRLVSTAAEDRLSFPGGAIRMPSFASQRLQNDRDLSITQALSLVQRLLLVVHTGLSKKTAMTELCCEMAACNLWLRPKQSTSIA
jgi:hypothetical protein